MGGVPAEAGNDVLVMPMIATTGVVELAKRPSPDPDVAAPVSTKRA